MISAGLSLIGPSVEVTTRVPTPMGVKSVKTDNEEHWWNPPHAYAAMPVNEKVWIGIGIYCPFGLGSVFDSEWTGRYNSYKAIIEAVDVNPNVAYKVTDQISVAAGLQIMTFDLLLKRKLPNAFIPGGPDLDFKLEGDDVGYGGNAALSIRPNANLGVGLVYRSEVRETVRGDAVINAMGQKMSTPGSGSITLPASSTLGANYRKGALTLGAAVTYTEWSSYDELKVRFDNPAVLGVSESRTEKAWNDVWRYGAGAEYALNDTVTLRVSYVYDEDPIPDRTADYLVPSNDRHLFGLGAGVVIGPCRLDLGYTYLMIEDRKDVPARLNDGVFASDFKKGDAHIFGVTLGGSF